MIRGGQMTAPEVISGDRRKERRYDFQMDLRYRYQRKGREIWGTGRTLDLSRCAVRFEADEAVPDGTNLELQIAWPFLLQGVCPLVLMVWGVVLRSDARGIILRMSNHEFRTSGERSFAPTTVAAGARSFFG